MYIIFDKHKNFLIELIKANIEFILIGGYSVIFHGYTRTTGDMDLWLKPSEETKLKLIPILEKYGISKEDINELSKLDFKNILAFHLGSPPERIDFLTKIAGLEFEESFRNADNLELKEFKIPVLRLNDLIVNKLMSGRMKDLADIDELKKIRKSDS